MSRQDPAGRGPVRRPERVGGRCAAGSARRGAPSGVLTTRAAVLGLVLCALVVSAALPLREYFTQRGRIERLEQQQAAQRERVVALERERRLLDDPAYTARLARERLHYVHPGETAYVVLAPESDERFADGSAQPDDETAPWYSRLLGSVREADGDTASTR